MTDDPTTPALDSLWKRRNGREVLVIRRVWTYFGELTVRGHPIHGGRPLVASVTHLRQHYEEVQ